MRTGTSATLLWFITLSCIVRCSSLVSLSTPVAETAANATKVATEVLPAQEGRSAGDAKHVGSVKTQTKGPERKRQFLERFAEAKGSIEVPNAEVAETHLDEQAAWTGPYTSEGVGLVGSLAASLDQCKARCMAETSCHVVSFLTVKQTLSPSTGHFESTELSMRHRFSSPGLSDPCRKRLSGSSGSLRAFTFS